MTDDRQDSLADQAAAWVPPWARPRTGPEAQDAAEPGPSSPEPAAEARPVAAEPHGPVAAEPSDEGARLGTGKPDAEARPRAGEPDEEARPVAAEPDDEADDSVADQPELVAAAAGEPALVDVPGAAVDAAWPGSGPADTILEPAAALALDPVQVAADPDGETAAADPDGEMAAADPDGEAAAADPGADGRSAAGDGSRPDTLDADELRGALEAILLVVDEPVSDLVLAQVLEQPAERVAALLQAISADYTASGHGFDLRQAAGGWRLYTRPEYATYVERFILDGQSVRLTQAALETLAVVAYKQPVTRSRISAIRGVNCDGTIRTLVSRGLVEECGSEPDSGAFLYRTTTMFLEKLGLNSADELPPLAPFLPDDLEEIADAPR